VETKEQSRTRAKLYRERNRDNPEYKAKKAAQDKAYRLAHPYSSLTEEQKVKKRAQVLKYHAANRIKIYAQKQEYYKTEAGKACKKREEQAYKANGKREAAEKRRAERPLSEARKLSKVRYYIRKAASAMKLDEFDKFVIDEAHRLARLREKVTNIKSWHIDHIIPVSLNGLSDYSNLQVVPAKWNQSKGNKHANRFFII
jgi:hypothetical protein